MFIKEPETEIFDVGGPALDSTQVRRHRRDKKVKLLPVLNIGPCYAGILVSGGEWLASCRSHFNLSTHWIGGWVKPRANLDIVGQEEIQPTLLAELIPANVHLLGFI
jgi:hypothetical protein